MLCKDRRSPKERVLVESEARDNTPPLPRAGLEASTPPEDPPARQRARRWPSPVLMLVASTFFLGLPPGIHGQEAPSYRYFKEIPVELQEDELVAVPLDEDVYQHSSEDLADLRVLDAEGREVPFLVRKATEVRTETITVYRPARLLDFRPLPNGGFEARVERPQAEGEVDAIRLITPLKNYHQQVRVWGSRDGQDWQVLAEDAVIFDYSKYVDVSANEIPLPSNDFVYFRIQIGELTAEQESELMALTRRIRGDEEVEREERIVILRRPFRIDRVELREKRVRTVADRPRVTYQLGRPAGPTRDPERGTTLWEVTTKRQPLTAIRVQVAEQQRNFSRRARLEIPSTSGPRETWGTIAEASLTRIRFRNLQREDLTIRFSEQRSERYRLLVHDGNSPPLEIVGLLAEGPIYQIVFLASPGQRYRVVYGGEDASPPQHNTTVIVELLNRGYQPRPIEPGPEQVTSGVVPERRRPLGSLRAALNNPVLLGAIIVILVALLAVSLVGAARRVEELAPRPEEAKAETAASVAEGTPGGAGGAEEAPESPSSA